MLAGLLNFFRGEEDRSPSFIRLTRNILIFVMAANLAVLPFVGGVTGEEALNVTAAIALLATFVLESVALIYVLRGQVLFAKFIVPTGLLAALSIIALNTNGIRDVAFLAMPAVLVVSALLLGRRALTLILPLMVIAAIGIAANDLGTRKIASPVGIDDAIIVPILFIGTAGILHLLISRMNESLQRARESEQIQRLENQELTALRITLEERVSDRTAELERANETAEKSARQFQAVAQVMNAVSSIQSLETLLPRITEVISEQFNIHHTGVFLLDEKREFAVLRAANSEGGKRMLARKHSLAVGLTGLVGFVTATGRPRITLDAGADSVYFDNPDLPDTHSEATLPLRYAGRIIGALDVQSVERNAFQPDDVNVLTTLADQVAVAINNALTLELAQRSLAEAQSAIGNLAQEAWQALRPSALGLGYSFSDLGVKPLDRPIENPEAREALSRGGVVRSTEPGQTSRLAVPLRLRGQIVGVMQLSSRGGHAFDEDDADIAEGVAERLSLAIETATLLQATQRRADIEKVTANITSRISSSAQFETILQTAARELSRALGGSDVLVQIEPSSMKMIMDGS
jgi:GAF domain-containing protein